jgi:osmoprotectant transport system permease protein
MSAFQYIADNWDSLGPQVLTHVVIVLICVAASGVLGLALGIVAARSERLSGVVLAATSTIITVPSFALFGLLSIFLGLGNPPVIVGLVLYALLPVTRNTRVGLLAVDAAVLEAARGMGMSATQVLLRVQLPLAVPVILAGLRQAAVMVCAIATVGAQVGVNDLGQPIFQAVGRSIGSMDHLLSGVIPVLLIALIADTSLGGLQRALSRGRVAVAAT